MLNTNVVSSVTYYHISGKHTEIVCDLSHLSFFLFVCDLVTHRGGILGKYIEGE